MKPPTKSADVITVEEYESLKREVTAAKAEADKAAGALEQLMKRLKDEFGCNSLAAARQLLTDYKSKRDATKTKFDRALTDYKKNWNPAT